MINLDDGLSSIDISSLPSTNFEELYNKWYKSKIDMIIVAPNDTNFINELIPLMEWKNQKGVKTIILSNFSEYAGSDNAEKIRNMIKDYHENENIQWVLLAGDAEEDLIPIRYTYNPDTVVVSGQTEYSSWNESYKPTDFYYSALSGTWNEDGDCNWGENPENNVNGVDEIVWNPDVYVGRLPASNANELQIMVNKTLKYEINPEIGSWMNQMLLAGGVSSFLPPEDEARLTEYIWQNYILNHMNFTHLTKTTSSFTPSLPPEPNVLDDLNGTSFINGSNEGYSTIIIAGHADPTRISDASGTTFYTNTNALSSSNINKTSLIYADACTTSSYDQGDSSIGERLIKRLNAGAIGYIGGLRVTWYLDYDTELEKLNRGNAKLFWKQFFEEMDFQQGKALYNSKVAYLNSDYFQRGETSINLEWQRKNILTYNLLGDPEVDIYTDIPVSIPNYFVSPIHEGQLVSFSVIDNKGRITPNARVHLTTLDGKYFTAYSNKEGIVKFRLPAQSNEKYNVTITGHNLIPTYLNFTTIKDKHFPELRSIERIPNTPTIS
ncbi:MAG: C25 family cysteine peptidase, partial [Promethearchaeota archaeon]